MVEKRHQKEVGNENVEIEVMMRTWQCKGKVEKHHCVGLKDTVDVWGSINYTPLISRLPGLFSWCWAEPQPILLVPVCWSWLTFLHWNFHKSLCATQQPGVLRQVFLRHFKRNTSIQSRHCLLSDLGTGTGNHTCIQPCLFDKWDWGWVPLSNSTGKSCNIAVLHMVWKSSLVIF